MPNNLSTTFRADACRRLKSSLEFLGLAKEVGLKIVWEKVIKLPQIGRAGLFEIKTLTAIWSEESVAVGKPSIGKIIFAWRYE